MQILEGFSKFAPFTPKSPYFIRRWDEVSGRFSAEEVLLERLTRVKPRDVVSGHLPATPSIIRRVTRPDFLAYFIYRDPRDVVISHAFYATDKAGNWKRSMYQHLPMEERIRLEITGFRDDRIEYPDIRKRFDDFDGWFGQTGILTIRFEELIHARWQTLGRIAGHFLQRVDTLPMPENDIVKILEKCIEPERSPTFRSGKTGGWKQHFTNEHKSLFKDVAGDLLVKLGYEENNDW